MAPGQRRSMGNLGWLLLDRLVRMGMGLFVGVWVARYLGPVAFGSLNFAMAVIALFGTVATLGLDAIIVRAVLDRAEDAHEILGTSLFMRATGSLAGAALCIIGVRLLQPHDREALLLVSLLSLTFVFQSLDTIDAFFQSQVRSRLTVLAKNSAFVVFVLVRVLLIHRRAPLWTFAAAYTGEIALGALGLLVAYRVTQGRMSAWTVRRHRAAQLLRQSWPIMLSGMAIMTYVRLDTVMLKVMQGDYVVGTYAAATRISEVWYFVPSAIVSSVSPAILRVKDNELLFQERMRLLFAAMTACAVAVGTLVALSSTVLVHVLYSDGYKGAAPVLAVHVWASVFVFLGVAQSPWDLAKDLMKLSLYRTVAGAVINAALNLWLIPRYAALGAAIATVISYAASGVFANALFRETRPVFVMQMRSFVPQRFWTKRKVDHFSAAA